MYACWTLHILSVHICMCVHICVQTCRSQWWTPDVLLINLSLFLRQDLSAWRSLTGLHWMAASELQESAYLCFPSPGIISTHCNSMDSKDKSQVLVLVNAASTFLDWAISLASTELFIADCISLLVWHTPAPSISKK